MQMRKPTQTNCVQPSGSSRTVISESDCVCEGGAVLTWQRNNKTVVLSRNNGIAHAIRYEVG